MFKYVFAMSQSNYFIFLQDYYIQNFFLHNQSINQVQLSIVLLLKRFKQTKYQQQRRFTIHVLLTKSLLSKFTMIFVFLCVICM